MRRSVIWVGAVALAAAILLVTSPAPPAAARGADASPAAAVLKAKSVLSEARSTCISATTVADSSASGSAK